MKKYPLMLAIFMVLAFTNPALGSDYVSGSIIIQNTFTETISASYGTNTKVLNVSIQGTWVGTVTLQKRFGSTDIWRTCDTWTSNTEEWLWDATPGVQYRIGSKTGEFTSGTMLLRLTKGE